MSRTKSIADFRSEVITLDQSGRSKPLGALATIYSQLYADAYSKGAGYTLGAQATAISPAHLPKCSSLDDLPITWLALR